MSPVPATVAEFRARYRAEQIGPRYSGRLHLASTSLASLLAIGLCAHAAPHPRPLEWLTVPLAFLFANLVEYAAHRGPMHHRARPDFFLTRLLYQRHALSHHRFYTDEAMTVEEPRDYQMVLFPPAVVFLFIGGVAVPVLLALRLLVSANVGFLFGATAVGYFLTYEWLHLAYHLPPESWVGRLPFLARLRRHHTAHHDPRRMQRFHFNITFPITDALFGTTYRDR
mgnify:CR=1 FL=1